MAEYMTVENGIITGVYCGYEYTEPVYDDKGELIKPAEKIIPENAIDLPANHEVRVGDNINMYNADYTRKTGNELLNVISEEEKANYHRAKRDSLLKQADILQLKYQEQVELGVINADDDYRLSLLQYKENLRNVPEQEGFPENVVWPELPARA